MQINQEWYDMLDRGYVTPEILGQCLYSCNKRAAGERAIEYDLREKEDIHGANQHKKVKKNFYRNKSILLSLVRPKCIHIVRYMTPHEEYYHVTDRYYLCYEVGGYSCYHPIKEEMLPRYRHLPKYNVGSISVDATEDHDLVPEDYIEKLTELVRQKKIRLKSES